YPSHLDREGDPSRLSDKTRHRFSKQHAMCLHETTHLRSSRSRGMQFREGVCSIVPVATGCVGTRRLSQPVRENSGSHLEALCVAHLHFRSFSISFERPHAPSL